MVLPIVERRVIASITDAAGGRRNRLERRTGLTVELTLPVVPGALRRAVGARDRIRGEIAAEPWLHRAFRAGPQICSTIGGAATIGVAREVTRTEQTCRARLADALGDVVARRALPTLFCRDHNDTVRGARAIDGCRRRRLQHFDALDIVGVEVRESIHRLVLRRVRRSARASDRRETAGDRRIRDDDAVDDIEWIALPENRRRAADLDLHTAAGNAAVLVDRRSDDLAGELRFD